MSIKHKKHVFAEDGTDPNAVHPSDWNDDHILDGFLGLFADVGAGPDQFPYIRTDGTGALAPVTAPARNMLAQVTTALMLAAIGGASTDSPAFTGTPTAPTPALGLNTNQVATMAAIQAAIANLVNAAPTTLDTLKELADAIGDDPNFTATMTAALGNRVRFDAAQSLTAGQITQAISNLALAASFLRFDAAQTLTAPQKAQAIANLALAAVATSGAYTDLSGRPTLGTAAALNVGTAASQIVQLDGSAKLPAIDGSQLTALGVVKTVRRQVFTASGTYTPSAGMLYAVLECVAGGGGGGGSTASGGVYDGGGGGGGGGYARLFASAATIGASKAVTIGAGGTAGAAAGGAGGAGGDSSVGTLCVAKGAGGGTGGTASTGGTGGSGGGSGLGGTGDIQVPGKSGESGMYINTPPVGFAGWGSGGGNAALGFGMGGRPAYSQNGGAAGSTPAGVAGTQYGAGGSGSICTNYASGNVGGAGAAGVVIITEFCSQ